MSTKANPKSEAGRVILNAQQHWPLKTLGAMGVLHCGQSPSSAQVNRAGQGIPYVSGPEHWDGSTVRLGKWTTQPKRCVPAGCVFITVKGAGVGTVFPGVECAIGRDIYAFEPNQDVDRKFIEHIFRHTAGEVIRSARGDIPGLSKSDLLNHEVVFPPLPEQRRIVAEIETQFTRLDAGVAALRRVQANLKRYRSAVLKAACEGRLVSTEAELAKHQSPERGSVQQKGGTPDFESGAMLLDRILKERRQNWRGAGTFKKPIPPDAALLPPLPEGWTWATLPQLGELNRGKSKHRPRDDDQLYGGPYPFIQTGDIRKSRGTIRQHTQTYSEFGLRQSRLWPEETLCITIAANIAETGILKFQSCFPDSVVGFIHDGNPATTRYVEFFIRTAKEKLAQFAPATAQKNINLDVLQKVAIPLPPLAEQTRIVAEVERRLSVVEELETVVNANLQRATRLRQSVLQQAFRGGLAGGKNRQLERSQ